MKTLNKMKDKLQREGVELRSAREQVLDLSSRINDIAVSSFAFYTVLQYDAQHTVQASNILFCSHVAKCLFILLIRTDTYCKSCRTM